MARDRLGGKKTLKVTGFLQEFEKDTLKNKVDIITLFNEFGITLTKKGKSYVGLCPWHEDKKPSLSVDREKGLYNCFGCGESGDVFNLVEKVKSCDFKEALKFLKERSSDLLPRKEVKAKQEKEKSPTQHELSLSTITDYYHKKLYQNKKARSYLEKRGMTNPETYARFKLGYADGSLLKVSSNGQKEALKVLGLVRDKCTEHFYGCIVFPILDNQGQTLSMYGRSIVGSMHLYLPGQHKGVFNRKASRVYEEIILTESIIDALSLIHLGIDNVQSCYGTNGFTDEHLGILKADRVKIVVIAFDNDEAGRLASDKLKERLFNEGFAVKVINPDKVKDWNDYLIARGTKEQVKALLNDAELFKSNQEDKEAFEVKRTANRYDLKIGDNSYRVLGVKELFVSSLRVAIRTTHGNNSFCDTVDLYSSRSRKGYANNLCEEVGELEPVRIVKDLNRILDYLEQERDKKLNKQEDEKKVVVGADDKEVGIKFLKDPLLFERIVDDYETLGYVGEEINKLLVSLAAISRLLPDPLNIYIQSGSSTGKSYLLETLMQMLPDECMLESTSFSDTALYYCEEDYFLGKVFIMGEAIHDEKIEGQVRQMQSEKKLTRMVTLKDEKTGLMQTRFIKKRVRMSFMTTSTALYLNPENASRSLVIHVDETAEQTARILAKQRNMYSPQDRVKYEYLKREVVRRHLAAQRLLREVMVVNPYARYIKFPVNRPIMRRGHKHFLNLNNTICLARQLQKQEHDLKNPYTNETVRTIACDIDDYRLSYKLYREGVMLRNRNDIPAPCERLYENIRVMVGKEAKRLGVDPCEVKFIQRKVRELTGLSDVSVKRYMRMLTDYEYIQITSGVRQGTRYSYRLREDKPIEEIDMSVIPTPEEMEEMIEKDEAKPGNWG